MWAKAAGPNHSLCVLVPDRAVPSSVDGLLFCARCGAYSTAKVVGLRGPCPGRPFFAPARTRLKHMMSGSHPRKEWTGVVSRFSYFWEPKAAPVLLPGVLKGPVAEPPVTPAPVPDLAFLFEGSSPHARAGLWRSCSFWWGTSVLTLLPVVRSVSPCGALRSPVPHPAALG